MSTGNKLTTPSPVSQTSPECPSGDGPAPPPPRRVGWGCPPPLATPWPCSGLRHSRGHVTLAGRPPVRRVLKYADARDFRRRLRLGEKRHHEQTEGEGHEKLDPAACHGSLLGARTCGGILRAMCQGRKSKFDPHHEILPEFQTWALLFDEVFCFLVKPLESFRWD